MLSARTKIYLIYISAAATVALLAVAALGLWSNFYALKLGIMIGLSVLGLLLFTLGYRIIGIASILGGIFFGPYSGVNLPRHIWVILDMLVILDILFGVYWTTNPWVKGARFEKYVQKLFPEPDFVVVDRTRDNAKFLKRKVESDSHPDFIFRNTKTGKTFAVECKWRSRWYYVKELGGLGFWWDVARGERYKWFGIEKGIPVYIAYGIGGTPDKPAETVFLDINVLNRSIFTQSEIRNMSKTPVQLF